MKIEKGIFQKDALSPLNHIIRKRSGRYKLHKSQKNQPPNVHRWNQIIYQKWGRTINYNTGSENIQSRYRDGIWHRKMCHANNEKQKMTCDRGNKTTKWRKNLNPRRNGNLQILANTGSGNHEICGDERINKNKFLKRTRKLLETKQHISSKV